MRIAVVGAGLAGLAVAIRLARAGHRVAIHERLRRVGGKLCDVRATSPAGPFRFDGGATLLTLPGQLDELFALCGERRAEHLPWTRVEPGCRYFFADGTVIDQDAALWARPAVARYLERARVIFEMAEPSFLSRPPAQGWRGWPALLRGGARGLGDLLRSGSLADFNAALLPDPHLRRIFDRFATYVGSSPFHAPVALASIAHVEASGGSWYPRGGMARIADALAGLARRQGVEVHLGAEVADPRALDAERVVSNVDVLEQQRRLGWPGLPAAALSCSGYALWLGLRGAHPQLAHHNVFFSDDSRHEFADIFERQQLPRDPTIYVGVPGRSGERDAPAGHEAWYLLVNAPARIDLDVDVYAALVLRRLARFGLHVDPAQIVVRRHAGPAQFAARDRAFAGAFYGWASHSRRRAFLRPPVRDPQHPRLFHVGGTVHPGGGIPLVLRSAAIAADAIARGDGLVDFDADADGVRDPGEDPGCDSAADDDESNLRLPQCADGVDNDNDGATDAPADAECQSSEDDSESIL